VEKRLGKGNVGFSALGVPHHCLLQRLRIICPVLGKRKNEEEEEKH
jgi:hypothetical protein